MLDLAAGAVESWPTFHTLRGQWNQTGGAHANLGILAL